MPIHHVILLRFKPHTTPDEVQSVRESLHGLHLKIPAISGVKAGKKIAHPLDHGFDEGVIFVFKDEEALTEGYMPHPAHREYQEYTASYIQDKLIFDIYSDE